MATNIHFVDTLGGTSNLLVNSISDIMFGLSSTIASVVATTRVWQVRAEQRKHLASLDSRLLEDMGMSREEAVREGNKSFWTA